MAPRERQKQFHFLHTSDGKQILIAMLQKTSLLYKDVLEVGDVHGAGVALSGGKAASGGRFAIQPVGATKFPLFGPGHPSHAVPLLIGSNKFRLLIVHMVLFGLV